MHNRNSVVRTISLVLLFLLLIIFLAIKTDVFRYTPEYRELTQIELTQVMSQRERAFRSALTCSGLREAPIPFDSITWILVPGRILELETIEGRTLRLLGYWNPTENVIYMPFSRRNDEWIMAHESMHALGFMADEKGVHPYEPFGRCNLLTEQN